jgi:hypothetical protein
METTPSLDAGTRYGSSLSMNFITGWDTFKVSLTLQNDSKVKSEIFGSKPWNPEGGVLMMSSIGGLSNFSGYARRR